MHYLPSRPKGGFFTCLIALFMAAVTPAHTATLLPPGKQTFIDQNGAPLALGTVSFYIPGTSTPKATWQDAAQTILNTNPVTLDISGQAILYGSGCYRQVVKDKNGNTIWDQPTCDTSSGNLLWGGQSGGTANSQTVTASNFSATDGQTIGFIAGFSNTTALALVVNGGSPINVLRDTSSGSFSLAGGEVVATNLVQVTYDATRGAFHLINNPVVGSTPQTTLSGSGTTDLGSAGSRYISISGSATINLLGSSASVSFPFYTLTFTGASTLVYSANILIPGGVNLVTAPGDFITVAYQGSGVWRVINITRASGGPGILKTPAFQQISSCPWTTPLDALGNLPVRIDIEAFGGGGGGGGTTNGTAGGATSIFGINANGGSPGLAATNNFGIDGGLGGTGGTGTVDLRINGQAGANGVASEGASGVGAAGGQGGIGGKSAIGISWGGVPGSTSSRMNGNLGGGGAGQTSGAVGLGGSSGGGGGEYVRFTIVTPTTSIACAIGAGGAAGTSGGAGGIGGILTRSFWQ